MMLLLLLLSAVVFIGSLLLTFRFYEHTRENFTALLSYTFFFTVAAIIGIPMILGIFGILRPLPLIISVLGFGCFAGLLGLKFFTKNFRLKNIKVKLWPLLPFSFLLIFLTVEFINSLAQPVWEYDSIAYHLPFVRYWISGGSLWQALFTPYTGPVGYYPGSGEMMTLWNVLPIGADFFANAQNIFLAVIFGVTAYDFCRNLGFGRGPALLMPLLFLHSPIILKEVGSAHVDLFFAFGFLSILYFGWDFIRIRKPKMLLPLGLAFGLFVGSKYLALPYAVILGIPAAFYSVKFLLSKKISCSRFAIFFGLGLIGFFLAGGFWYVRNMVLTGNPIFPAEVKFGDFVIFKGYGTMTEQILNWSLVKNLDTWAEIKSFLTRYFFRTGWQTFLLVGSYFTGVLFFIFKKSLKKITAIFLVALPVFFYLYLATPYTYNDLDANIRYSILFLLSAALFTAFLTQHLVKIRAVFYGVSAVLILLTLRTALATPDLPHEPFNFNFIKPFVAAPTEIFQFREEQKFSILEHKYPNLAPLIRAFQWIEKNTQPTDAIAYSGFHFHYPLFGTQLTRPVKYVSINACSDCNYIDFQGEGGSIFAGADREIWLQNLTAANIKYLILFDQIGYLTYEPKWVSELPQKFERVFNDESDAPVGRSNAELRSASPRLGLTVSIYAYR